MAKHTPEQFYADPSTTPGFQFSWDSYSEYPRRFKVEPRRLETKASRRWVHNIRIKQARETSYREDGFPILGPEDQHFWGPFPPEGLIMTTSSLSRAQMLLDKINGLAFAAMNELQIQRQERDRNRHYTKTPRFSTKHAVRAENPAQYEQFVKRYVFNGNGQIKRGVGMVGYFHGVPVFFVPQTGETGSNADPIEQARLKVKSVLRKFAGSNFIIFGVDTVDHPHGAPEKLGKPMNEPDYPRATPWPTEPSAVELEENPDAISPFEMAETQFFIKKSMARNRCSADQQEQLEKQIELAQPRQEGWADPNDLFIAQKAYLEVFRAAFYSPGTQITHSNGFVFYDALLVGQEHVPLTSESPFSGEILRDQPSLIGHNYVTDWQIAELFFTITKDHKLVARPDAGGGGITQQTVDFVYAQLEELMAVTDSLATVAWRKMIREAESRISPETLAAHPDLPRLVVVWELYCQITGMPWAVLSYVLEGYQDTFTGNMRTKFIRQEDRRLHREYEDAAALAAIAAELAAPVVVAPPAAPIVLESHRRRQQAKRQARAQAPSLAEVAAV